MYKSVDSPSSCLCRCPWSEDSRWHKHLCQIRALASCATAGTRRGHWPLDDSHALAAARFQLKMSECEKVGRNVQFLLVLVAAF